MQRVSTSVLARRLKLSLSSFVSWNPSGRIKMLRFLPISGNPVLPGLFRGSSVTEVDHGRSARAMPAAVRFAGGGGGGRGRNDAVMGAFPVATVLVSRPVLGSTSKPPKKPLRQ